MKKTLFAALALAFVASCSNEEVVEMAQKEAISFENAFVNNSTRSVNDPSYTNANLFEDFKVYGYVNNSSLWPAGEKVTGSALNEEWSYTNTQYWINGASYVFHALAPEMAATTNASTGLTLSFTNTDGKSDVLYATATATGIASGNQPVKFDFKHILSKVKFSFENAYNSTNASIKVKDIKIHNAYKTGTVTLSSNGIAWTAQAGTTDNPLAFGIATDNEATTTGDNYKENNDDQFAFGITRESQEELLIIPGAAAATTEGEETKEGYKVTFTVELYVGNDLIKSYDHTVYANFTPVASNSYDIKAIIDHTNIDPEDPNGQEPIKFTVTNITDWTENNVDDILK